MSIIRHAFMVLASVALLGGTAAAQEAEGAQQQERPGSGVIVTAGATAAGVRFVSPGATRRIRLEVYTAAGERLFDSDFRAGGVLDWGAEGLADGSYLCVVTVEDLQGAQSRRLSSVALSGGRASAGREGEAQLKADFAQALAAAGLAQGEGAGAAARLKGKAPAATVTAHDGRDGQLTATSGALTLRTGDVFKGEDVERVRVTPEGRVGIGTDSPEAALDVAGEIRARGGIRFPDGTLLESARRLEAGAGKAAPAVAGAAGAPVSSAAMSGGKLAKFTDASGSLSDSVVTESGGFVGVGTQSPDAPLSVVGDHGTVATFRRSAASSSFTQLDIVAPTGTQEAGDGMSLVALGPTYQSTGPFVADGVFFGANAGMSGGLSVAARHPSAPIRFYAGGGAERLRVTPQGNVGIGTQSPQDKLDVAGNVKLSGQGSGIIFPDGTKQTTAGGATMTGTSIVSAVNDAATSGVISDSRLSPNVARLGGVNTWAAAQVFSAGLSVGGAQLANVGNPVAASDAANKAYVDSNAVRFVPGAEQLSVGDANGTAPMINLRGGSTCCSGPGGHTPAWFKVFQNGSFVATGNLGIGVSPMQGKGYRTSWDSYKGAFRSGYADNEWDDATVGFFSWAGGSNSTAEGLYAFAFGDTNFARSTSSIAFGSGNEVKGAAGFAAGAGNRVCDTYGVAFGNGAQSGGPLINGKCDPDTFNIRGLAAVAIGYKVTADQDHTVAFGKFASNNGFQGTFVWSDGSATASADTFRNTANNEFAARATGGFRFRTNLGGTTGCNLPAGSGVFNCTSSRTTKENFTLVDGDDVLARLRKVPVSTWNYISEGASARHLGPMAEDFYSAFALGTSDKAIGVQDAVGVSLAAVKALDARTLELQQKTAEVERLRAKVSSLEQRLAALEQALQANRADAKAEGAGQQR